MTVQVDLGAPLPQHMLALAEANRVRFARAELKRRIKAGEVAARDVILDPPEFARSMTVVDVLVAQHQWGGERAHRCLAGTFIGERKRLDALTVRQAHELAGRLEWA